MDDELRREEFKWQKQKFIITLVASFTTIFVIIYAVIFFGKYSSRYYLKELDEVSMRLKEETYETIARQKELSYRFEDLKRQQTQIEDLLNSVQKEQAVTRELIKSLSNEISELRAKKERSQ